MKKIIALVSLVCATGFVVAQELPKLSQPSKSEHVVGVTKISLEYSRPSVRGRVIFGEVVPYNEVWRLGANEPTKITTSNDLSFKSAESSRAGQTLPAGTYAVFAIPAADGNWKIVFNTDYGQWGAGSYDSTKNVVTIAVKAAEGAFTETLSLDINKVTLNGASLVIAWDKVWIEVPFSVDTDAHVRANIDAAITEGKDLDKVYVGAASYYFNFKEDMDKATTYVDQSIAVKKTSSNMFLKARIYYKKGDVKGAIKLAEEAKALAAEEKNDRWVAYIQENLDEWSKK
jgi:hypothetical protein